ncbi:choice-of-anchor P family protein [Actinokineospora enzanensis]|uniref:choice-of-anchor P family protein n=1 Tax=Actinokineospora enzanensis TaxID=155975 RepID=UPI000381261F|nr:choice-of-anchor P family protein [Actinokineospora enzanensis]
MRTTSRRWLVPAALALVGATSVALAQPAAAAPPAYTFAANATPFAVTLPVVGTTSVGGSSWGPTTATGSNVVSPFSAPAIPIVGTPGTVSSTSEGTDDGVTRTARAVTGVSGTNLLAGLVQATDVGSTSSASTDSTGAITTSTSTTLTGVVVAGVPISPTVPANSSFTFSVSTLLGTISGTAYLNEQSSTATSASATAVRVVATVPVLGSTTVVLGDTSASLTP